MTCSPNNWASTETLRLLLSKMEAVVNEHTPGQDFAVLMDIAPVDISAETEQVLREEFVHIRIIMMSKGRMDANSRLVAADSKKKRSTTQDGKTQCCYGKIGCMK